MRSQLHLWAQAIDDAEYVGSYLLFRLRVLTLNVLKSIEVRPSVIGYIAKSVALIRSGQKEKGCHVFNLALVLNATIQSIYDKFA